MQTKSEAEQEGNEKRTLSIIHCPNGPLATNCGAGAMRSMSVKQF